jgi:hypothetical protein
MDNMQPNWFIAVCTWYEFNFSSFLMCRLAMRLFGFCVCVCLFLVHFDDECGEVRDGDRQDRNCGEFWGGKF